MEDDGEMHVGGRLVAAVDDRHGHREIAVARHRAAEFEVRLGRFLA